MGKFYLVEPDKAFHFKRELINPDGIASYAAVVVEDGIVTKNRYGDCNIPYSKKLFRGCNLIKIKG